MEALSGEAPRRAEAGDYHPESRHRPPTDETRMSTAAVALRRNAVSGVGPGDNRTYGLLACAQLLEEIAHCRRRDQQLSPALYEVAAAIADHVLDPEPVEAAPARPRRAALHHCLVRAPRGAP